MNKLRYFRFFAGKSLDEIAQAANISIAKLSRAERGFANLSESEKELVAKALSIEMGAIFPKSEEKR